MKAQNNSTPRSSFVSECFPDDPHPASGHLLPGAEKEFIFWDVFPGWRSPTRLPRAIFFRPDRASVCFVKICEIRVTIPNPLDDARLSFRRDVICRRATVPWRGGSVCVSAGESSQSRRGAR